MLLHYPFRVYGAEIWGIRKTERNWTQEPAEERPGQIKTNGQKRESISNSAPSGSEDLGTEGEGCPARAKHSKKARNAANPQKGLAVITFSQTILISIHISNIFFSVRKNNAHCSALSLTIPLHPTIDICCASITLFFRHNRWTEKWQSCQRRKVNEYSTELKQSETHSSRTSTTTRASAKSSLPKIRSRDSSKR